MARQAKGKPSKEAQRQIRILKRLSVEQLAEVATLIITNDVNELDKVRRNRNASALQVWIASVAKIGIQSGDMHALDKILDRIVGKAKQSIEVSGPDGAPVPVTTMTSDQRVAEIERLRKIRELAGND